MLDLTVEGNIDRALWVALKNKQWDQAELLLAQGADVNQKSVADVPFFLWCVEANRLDMAEWLAKNGADVNVVDRDGNNGLHLWMQKDLVDGAKNVERLLAMGVNADLPNVQGVTPLMMAVIQPNHAEKLAAPLLKAGVSVNQLTAVGNSILGAAVARNHVALVGELVRRGAAVSAPNRDGRNAWHEACSQPDPSAFLMLKENCIQGYPGLDDPTTAGTRPLVLASMMGPAHRESIEFMIKEGCDVNAVSGNRLDNGASSFLLLIAGGDAAMVQLALDHGADLSFRDQKGQNALAYATFTSNRIDLLLRQKLFQAQQEKSFDPKASGQSVDEFVKKIKEELTFDVSLLAVLLNNGADPRAPLDKTGYSPWHSALTFPYGGKDAKEKKLAALSSLMSMGFPLEPEFFGGRPTIAEAEAFALRHKTFAGQGLNSNDAMLFSPPLSYAIATKEDPAIIQALLLAGADPNFSSVYGRTALDAAVTLSLSSKEETALMLFTKKALQTQDETKKAHYQEQAERVRSTHFTYCQTVWKELTDAGADWNQTNALGTTPLQTLTKNGSLEFLQAFLTVTQASLTAPDQDGLLPLHHAFLNGNAELAVALFEWHRQHEPEVLTTLIPDLVLAAPEDWAQHQRLLRALDRLSDTEVNWNAADADGNSPLILAAATQQADMISLLLQKKADPNRQNALGETALMHAVGQKNTDMIQELNGAGALSSLATVNGETAFTLAQKTREKSLLKALQDSRSYRNVFTYSELEQQQHEKDRQKAVEWVSSTSPTSRRSNRP